MVRSRPLPRPLEPGARIGVFALSGPVPRRRLEPGLEVVRSWGYEPVPAPNLAAVNRYRYLAGGDEERLASLESLLDAGVDALLAARGGYGIMRLLDRLPWDRLADWGGWIVGFSDVTSLHAALASRYPAATLHGPVGTTLTRHAPSSALVRRWLAGSPPQRIFRFSETRVLRPGRVRGVAVGGNLAVLAALEGTKYAPGCDGAVVFLEDVGEPLYRLDRLLTQLRLSSRLARATAIVAGRLRECGRGEDRWHRRWRELLMEAAPPEAAVIEGLPFGHGTANVPIPLGVEVELDTRRGLISWGGSEWSRSGSTRTRSGTSHRS